MVRLEFAAQCCDAVNYLDAGRRCFATGACYNDLRPLGAQLWFAWPAMVGLPAESTIVAHWALLALSVVLSALAFAHCASLIGRRLGGASIASVSLGSAAVHVVFFLPVMDVALADAPAGLLALSGLWTLLLAWGRDNVRWPRLMAAGLLLGLATWIRSFYLYPLIGALVLYTLIWVFATPRRRSDLALLASLLPVIAQYGATWYVHGAFGYIDPMQSAYWAQIHMSSPAAGYDTLLPAKGFPYESSCEGRRGLFPSLRDGALGDAACLAANRLYFYFGSYSTHSYSLGMSPSRLWNWSLLAANATALLVLAAAPWWAGLRRCRSTIVVQAFCWLILAQALLLVPEQRFVAVLAVVAWWATVGAVIAVFGSPSTRGAIGTPKAS